MGLVILSILVFSRYLDLISFTLPRKMVNCCVPLCKNYRHKKGAKGKVDGDVHISYHEFPTDIGLQLAWLKAINRKNFVINDKSNSSRVCSQHFKDEDYVSTLPGKKRCLKKGSIPSVFNMLPSSTNRQSRKIKLENNTSQLDAASTISSFSSSSTHCSPRKKKREENTSEINSATAPSSVFSESHQYPRLSRDPRELQMELKRREKTIEELTNKLKREILEVKMLKKQLTEIL